MESDSATVSVIRFDVAGGSILFNSHGTVVFGPRDVCCVRSGRVRRGRSGEAIDVVDVWHQTKENGHDR